MQTYNALIEKEDEPGLKLSLVRSFGKQHGRSTSLPDYSLLVIDGVGEVYIHNFGSQATCSELLDKLEVNRRVEEDLRRRLKLATELESGLRNVIERQNRELEESEYHVKVLLDTTNYLNTVGYNEYINKA